jgi:hypothetical protein
VDVLPRKGPASAESLDGDIALRRAFPIDLLVRRGEFSGIERALAKIGYLSAADLFLALAVPAAEHLWGRLVRICDLARLGSLPAQDWERDGIAITPPLLISRASPANT